MTGRRYGKEMAAVLPWVGVALIWFGWIAPLRASEAFKLAEQSQIRRDRLKASGQIREAQLMLARVKMALAASCRPSTEPAALRQRTIAATSGLRLSLFSLSVTGPPTPEASVEAEGNRAVILELARRLGDPGDGGFLRSVSIRDLGGRFGASAIRAPFETPSGGWIEPIPQCGLPSQSDHRAADPEPQRSPMQERPGTVRPATVRPATAEPMAAPTLALDPPREPPPPFALVGFLTTEGQPRVSVRSGNQVLVVSVGEQVLGWRCLSIDRDEGAVFEAARGQRVVLRASSSH